MYRAGIDVVFGLLIVASFSLLEYFNDDSNSSSYVVVECNSMRILVVSSEDRAQFIELVLDVIDVIRKRWRGCLQLLR
jgi:hypothetical protein